MGVEHASVTLYNFFLFYDSICCCCWCFFFFVFSEDQFLVYLYQTLSSWATSSVEEVASTGPGIRFFQLYVSLNSLAYSLFIGYYT